MAWTFSSETETGNFVLPYTVLLLSFRHGFHFQHIFIHLYEHFFLNLYYQTLKVRCLIMIDRLILQRMFISFSPCTWNLRSIESSDFEKKAWSFIWPNLNTLYYIKIWFWRRWNLKRLHTDDKTDGRTMDNRKKAQVISNTNWKLMKQHCFSSC